MTTAPRIWLFGDYNQAESRVVAWRGPVPKLRQWYTEGKDVHIHVTHLIARVIQENHIQIPNDLFTRKPWAEFVKGDEEREQSKRIVHGYNYEIGKDKMSIILGVPEALAGLLLEIYGKLFPEIKGNYHTWIREQLKRTRTLWMPEPVRFRKVFWDQITDDVYRQAYASYAQLTVGAMLNRTLARCARVFKEDHDEKLKDQWCMWYGTENWDDWRRLRDSGLASPQAILWGGMDIRLNIHDAGGISVPNDPSLVQWAAMQWRAFGQETIWIEKDRPLVIPVDFKTGKTWGSEDLKDYKIPA